MLLKTHIPSQLKNKIFPILPLSTLSQPWCGQHIDPQRMMSELKFQMRSSFQKLRNPQCPEAQVSKNANDMREKLRLDIFSRYFIWQMLRKKLCCKLCTRFSVGFSSEKSIFHSSVGPFQVLAVAGCHHLWWAILHKNPWIRMAFMEWLGEASFHKISQQNAIFFKIFQRYFDITHIEISFLMYVCFFGSVIRSSVCVNFFYLEDDFVVPPDSVIGHPGVESCRKRQPCRRFDVWRSQASKILQHFVFFNRWVGMREHTTR